MAGRNPLKRLQIEEIASNIQGIRGYAGTIEGQAVKSNGSYTAVLWDSQPAGLALFTPEDTVGTARPLIKGHSGPVLDFDFNPFNDQQIITASEDTTLKLWEYPEHALCEDLSTPLATFQGHSKKATVVTFNPSAAFIAASASLDNTLKIWAMELATVLYSLQPGAAACHCLQWNSSGSLIASSWKDQQIRLVDPRSSSIAAQFQAHDGAKPAKLAWQRDQNKLVTCGFSKNGDRKVAIWDLKNVSKPLGFELISSGTGLMYPFVDADLPFLFVVGKGDRSFSLFQLSEAAPGLQLLETCACPGPIKAFSLLPRRRLSPDSGEILRISRLIDENLSQIVIKPKRNEAAEDLYPACIGMDPGIQANQWAEGGNGEPERVSLREAVNLPKRGIAYAALERLVRREILERPVPQVPPSVPVDTEEGADLRRKLEAVTAENQQLRDLLTTYDQLLFGCSAAEYEAKKTS